MQTNKLLKEQKNIFGELLQTDLFGNIEVDKKVRTIENENENEKQSDMGILTWQKQLMLDLS